MQLSKMMEESESKKERDEEVQEMQQASLSLEGEIALLQQQLTASKASSAHLQQELHASRSVFVLANLAMHFVVFARMKVLQTLPAALPALSL